MGVGRGKRTCLGKNALSIFDMFRRATGFDPSVPEHGKEGPGRKVI